MVKLIFQQQCFNNIYCFSTFFTYRKTKQDNIVNVSLSMCLWPSDSKLFVAGSKNNLLSSLGKIGFNSMCYRETSSEI